MKYTFTSGFKFKLCTSFYVVQAKTHVHRGVDFCDGFIIRGKLVDLNTIADQLAHDFYLELV